MSTKFNRNDANVPDDKFYPEDYKTDVNAVEEDLEYFGEDLGVLPFIVAGLEVTSPTPTSSYVEVSAGQARDKDNHRVAVGSTQQVTLTDLVGGDNYIVLDHKYSTDTPRNAYHTGTEYNTRKYDDFELSCVGAKPTDKIILANVKREGGQNVIYTDERTGPVPTHQQNTDTHTSQDEFYVGGPEGTGKKALKAQPPPPTPTRLRLLCGWEADLKKDGFAGSTDHRVSKGYVKAKWGDYGSGTGGTNSFTVTESDLGSYDDDEWTGQYLCDSNSDLFKVTGNTGWILTVEGDPASGSFVLGPNAEQYRAIGEYVPKLATPDGKPVRVHGRQDIAESAVANEMFFWGIEPGSQFRVKGQSLGSWLHESDSPWTSWVTIDVLVTRITAALNAKATPKVGGIVISCDSHPDADGIEIAYTEDGKTVPDFAEKSHLYVAPAGRFTVQIPTAPKAPVKAKVRYVDKSGQAGIVEEPVEAIAGTLTLDEVSDGKTYKRIKSAEAEMVSKAPDVSKEVVLARGDQASLADRMDEVAKAVTDLGFYVDHTVANDASGSQAPALPATKEEGDSYIIKRRWSFVKRAGRNYAVTVFRLGVTSAGQKAWARMTVDYLKTAYVETSSEATFWDVKTLAYDVSDASDGDIIDVSLALKLETASPGNPAKLSKVTFLHSETAT